MFSVPDAMGQRARPSDRGSVLSRCDRCVGHQRQAFAGVVVDYRQDALTPPLGHLVVHKVEQPALVRPERQQILTRAVDMKIQHRLCRLERARFSRAAAQRRRFERGGNALRVLPTEYSRFQVERIARLGELSRSFACASCRRHVVSPNPV
jgi:hypothetical protein